MATTTKASDPVAAAKAAAEEAERTAQVARRKAAEAEQAEAERREQQRAAREPHIAAWWTAEREGYPDRWVGKADAAWKKFTAAVRDGGDVIAAWREYKVTRRRAQADFRAVNGWFKARENRAKRAYLDERTRLRGEASALDGRVGGMGMAALPAEEAEQRTARLRAEAEAHLGAPVSVHTDTRGDTPTSEDVLRAVYGALHDPRNDPPKPDSTPSPGPGGLGPSVKTFGEALDKAVAELEEEAVRADEAERTQRRRAYVADKTGQALDEEAPG